MGGRSSEHEVSLMSAATVIENINTDIYNVIMIGITKDGQWKLIDSMDKVKDGTWVKAGFRRSFPLRPERMNFVLFMETA